MEQYRVKEINKSYPCGWIYVSNILNFNDASNLAKTLDLTTKFDHKVVKTKN